IFVTLAELVMTKNLSFEEKRKRMGDYFLEKRDYFQLKELEKHLPKEKGIVQQSVKEVLQTLVDDRLVNLEKIGTSNYYWSFPSTALQTAELEKYERQSTELKKQVSEALASRPDGAERETLINDLEALKKLNHEYSTELEQFKEMDPDLFEQKNRWTDNILTLQSHCANSFNLSRSDFASQFGLAEDFDYVQ
ncbi:mnd1 recombination and meiotic nuclear division, partial [Paramicrosporidium saccamoebae]